MKWPEHSQEYCVPLDELVKGGGRYKLTTFRGFVDKGWSFHPDSGKKERAGRVGVYHRRVLCQPGIEG